MQPAGSRIGPRRRQEIQLMLIHAGSMRLRLDGGPPRQVAAGEICLLLPGHTEEIRFDGDVDTHETLVRGRMEQATDQMRAWLEALRPNRTLSSALTYLAREAVTTEQTRLTADGALVDALATALLWRFIAEFRNLPAALPASIETARLFIHDHLDRPVTLTDIARAASVTPAHLVRMFRSHMDTTPVQYLWDRRISLGVELLTSTGLTVGSIATRCGFKTSFHFSRKVKESTGLSPTDLRTSTSRT
ncbi:AraC family transcriptional regulator, arabinose operon regulatory protein [Glycomyces sambucus]|uniref:AraC family transcriptional regulator, arabinose operon regulatory protein n=1 Tax=Glycomyces sambucus TaxID=380244 RepID=A0A1G9ND28_9ACTN|nr:AraC family transcriptional regulator, arabinose operon regulatory protein [Glycomyces sambucus]SDL84630.1 AraC family transcriptional regulator, arabinose operon regulatory protein [Glycomyces sambucus]